MIGTGEPAAQTDPEGPVEDGLSGQGQEICLGALIVVTQVRGGPRELAGEEGESLRKTEKVNVVKCADWQEMKSWKDGGVKGAFLAKSLGARSLPATIQDPGEPLSGVTMRAGWDRLPPRCWVTQVQKRGSSIKSPTALLPQGPTSSCLPSLSRANPRLALARFPWPPKPTACGKSPGRLGMGGHRPSPFPACPQGGTGPFYSGFPCLVWGH